MRYSEGDFRCSLDQWAVKFRLSFSDGRIGVQTFWNGARVSSANPTLCSYLLFLGDVLNFPSNYEIKVLNVVEEQCSKYLLNSR